MRGQLWRKEREFLHDLVVKLRPSVAYEVGTFNGGGSTLAIASALHRNGFGVLKTTDIWSDCVSEAFRGFLAEYPDLLPYIQFHCGDALQVFKPNLGDVDFVFLDGSEDPLETLAQMRFFEAAASPSTVFCCHDWGTSEKAKLVKQLVDTEVEHEYYLRMEPHGSGFEDGSVGIASWRLRMSQPAELDVL